MTASIDRAARRGRVFLCGLIPVIVTAGLAIYRPAFFPRLDDSIYDTVMRSGTIEPRGKRVVIPGMNNITLILRDPQQSPLDAIERLQRWWEESEAQLPESRRPLGSPSFTRLFGDCLRPWETSANCLQCWPPGRQM